MRALGERVCVRIEGRACIGTIRARSFQEEPRYDLLLDSGGWVYNLPARQIVGYEDMNEKDIQAPLP